MSKSDNIRTGQSQSLEATKWREKKFKNALALESSNKDTSKEL